MRSVKSSSAFTLIELMIVVVIIGILAAIAIPRFQARNNNTGSNAGLTQAASAQQQYKQQHNTYATTPAELATAGWDSTTAGNVRIVSATADSYCIESTGAGGNAGSQTQHVTQDGKVQAGTCQP